MKVFEKVIITILLILLSYNYINNNKKIEYLKINNIEKTKDIKNQNQKIKELEKEIIQKSLKIKRLKIKIEEEKINVKKECINQKIKGLPIGKPIKGEYTIKENNKKYIIFKVKNNTNIYSTSNGVVRYITNNKKYGKNIIISNNYGYETKYAGLKTILFKIGDKVKKGDIIGYSGKSMNNMEQLFYEIRYSSLKVNTKKYLKVSKKSQIKLINE